MNQVCMRIKWVVVGGMVEKVKDIYSNNNAVILLENPLHCFIVSSLNSVLGLSYFGIVISNKT